MSEIEDPTADLEKMLNEEFSKVRSATLTPEDAPEVVRDAPPDRTAPAEPPAPEPVVPDTPDEEEVEEPDDEGDPDLAWATQRYGDDPNKWAKVARDQEAYISRLANEKREQEELAQQWYEYAQQQGQQSQQFTGLPLSAQEEMWVENSVSNPLEYARQAAYNGKGQLFNGVIERVAQDNPMMASQIATQINLEIAQLAAAPVPEQTPFPQVLHQSLNRLGIDPQKEGPRMLEKIQELGNYNPYVQKILGGTDGERDLAFQAVYDLTRASTFSTRPSERAKAVAREEELRHEASVVQTGGIQPPPPPRQKSLLEQGMEAEWRRAGAWPYPEE